jgi:hypothetical protein
MKAYRGLLECSESRLKMVLTSSGARSMKCLCCSSFVRENAEQKSWNL